MKRILFFLVIMLFGLAACGQSDNQGSGDDSADPQPLEVDLQVPEQADSGEAVSMTAKVTQGGENVGDADEVEFEVWQEGAKDDSEMIEAEYQEDGVYGIEKTFETDGTYFVQSHVTARQMHIMPKKSIVIGNAEDSDTDDTKEDHSHGDEESTGDDDSAHHHHDSLAVELDTPESLTVHEEIGVTVSVKQDDEPLNGANVTLEIYHNPDEDPQWVNLTEGDNGIYEGNVTFEHNGTHEITIHVKKGDLHTHEETTLEVEG
ncbi:FixH family protein [Sediminibacillus halophilus]|uniref:YtkA-like n=1 Tax=Sediminibacillus halophilus TaxID=482461 RepID=A0A1G9R9R1_9BACI|nr:FixH family protein [Sediminibacillus halophilus]SDM19996.1 YtkA-like [Sediminibacillus halophilus]